MKIISKVASVYRNIWRAAREEFEILEEDFHPDVHEEVKEEPPAQVPDPPDPPLSAAASSGPSSATAPVDPSTLILAPDAPASGGKSNAS